MANETLKPSLRFKGFTDAWEQRMFGNEVALHRGLTYSPSSLRKSGIRVLRSSNINEDVFVINDDDVFVSEDAINIDFANNGEILITSANGSTRLVGKHAIISNLSLNSSVHGGFMLLGTTRNPYFINSSMSSSWYRKFIYLYVSGGNGAIGNLKKPDLDNYFFAVPTQHEQDKIGIFYKCVDSLITLHQRKYEALQNVKKSLLEKMFPNDSSNVPAIRFKGFTDAWEQHKLGNLGTTYAGLFGKNASDFGHGNANFVPYLNIFNNPITDISFLESVEIDNRQNLVKNGDIFFTTSSETPDEVGMSSVWTGNLLPVYLNSFCFGYRPKFQMDSKYMAFLLRSPSMRKKIVFLAQGISRYNISKNKMMDISIPLPANEEQRKVGLFLYSIDSLITLHQRKYEKLQNIKKSLLERMFV